MYDHYLNKFFQKLLFGNSGTAKVLLMVLVFLVNMGLAMGIDCLFIHSIPMPETEFAPASHFSYPDFRPYIDGEILDMYRALGAYDGGYHVLYRTDAGEMKLVRLDQNDVFDRFQLDKSSEITIPSDQNPYVHDEGNTMAYLRFTIEDDTIAELSYRGFHLFSVNGSGDLNIYMVVAVLMLLVETFILNKIKGKE